jgi:hypothetical protein
LLSSDLLDRVRAAGGLDADPFDPACISGALSAGRGLDAAVESFLTTLEAVNTELNGPMPSQTIGGPDRQLPADLVYAVSEVIRMLRDEGEAVAAWVVETAWLAVLAGDIDDVRAHVAEARRARDL